MQDILLLKMIGSLESNKRFITFQKLNSLMITNIKITYFNRSIPIRKIIDPNNLSLPQWHDEPLALFLHELTYDQRMKYLRTNSTIREIGGRYQRHSNINIVSLVTSQTPTCTIGYRRAIDSEHPVPGSGEYKIFEPTMILPNLELETIPPTDLLDIAKTLYGSDNFTYLEKKCHNYEQNYHQFNAPISTEKGILNQGDYTEKIDTLLSIKIDKVHQFYQQMKKKAHNLCNDPKDKILQIPALYILLTTYFLENIPLNPNSENIFSLENYHQRVEELKAMYQKYPSS